MARRSVSMLAFVLLATATGLPEAVAGYAIPTGYRVDSFVRVADRPVSMRDAINRVRQQSGGRVLDAQDQGTHYRIKVLTPDGEVRIYRVDAQTGAVR